MNKNLPETIMPRHRIVALGPTYMSENELMSIVIGSGVSEEKAMYMSNDILRNFNLNTLAACSISEVCNLTGLSENRASIISAMFELFRRKEIENVVKGTRFSNPKNVFGYLLPIMKDKKTENFDVLLLDTKNKLIKHFTTSIGSLNANIVHPREVFKEAITCSAAAIIVAHNHPSGDPSPSQSDIDITRKLVETGKIIGIEVYDHIIVGNPDFISLKESGMM